MTDIETRLQHARAEADMARRRAEADIIAARKYAIADFAKDLLPFKDALETALALETRDAQAMRAGLSVALRQLLAACARHAPINREE